MVCCVCMEMFGVGFSVIGGLLTSFVVASQLGICGHLNDILYKLPILRACVPSDILASCNEAM